MLKFIPFQFFTNLHLLLSSSNPNHLPDDITDSIEFQNIRDEYLDDIVTIPSNDQAFQEPLLKLLQICKNLSIVHPDHQSLLMKIVS